MKSRRTFLKTTGLAAGMMAAGKFSGLAMDAGNPILGHGKLRYSLDTAWGRLDPAKHPVKDCHEMVQDARKRLFLLTNEVKNNILIYDHKGRLKSAWGHVFPGAHGLTLSNENGTEFLFITDTDLHKVYKTTLDGRIVLTLEWPAASGLYAAEKEFVPTETAIAPNGDIYVADGYGKDYVLVYNAAGQFLRSFGGRGQGEAFLKNAHGITFDYRKPGKPTVLVTSREEHAFKRFTMEGNFLETIAVPGAWVCRPVIKGQYLYAAVLQSQQALWKQSGFITILDAHNRVVSNPGGNAPEGEGSPPEYHQTFKGFSYPHDVCVDDEGNIYLAQWNSNKVYPYKLKPVS